jgi:D-amino peptidase
MNVLISVDMEGISGVVAWEQVSPKHKEYERFRKLMTAEVNAAIEGALAGGAEQIVVEDAHGWMTNILIEELNPAAELISGSPKIFDTLQGIGPEVDAVFFVGHHALSGTGAAVLEHTWLDHLVEVRLNGQVVGEMGFTAALAGAYGVPVVLVTGDRAVVEEARTLLGEIETVAVKDGVTGLAARCLHPEVAQKHIRQAAERALRLNVAPFIVPSPITLRIVFQRAIHADLATMIPGSQRVDGRTVEWTGEDMPTVYKVFYAIIAITTNERNLAAEFVT